MNFPQTRELNTMPKTPFAPVSKAILLIAAALHTPVFADTTQVSNQFSLIGINEIGTLGSNGATSPGILFDPTGTANYGINDFLTPGAPFEGFYLSSSLGSWGSNNNGSSDFVSSNPVQTSSSSVRWTSTSQDGLIGLTNFYQLTADTNGTVLGITTSITNLSATSIDNLQFLRTLDPDPDVNQFGTYDTINTLGVNGACAEGAFSLQTICLMASPSSYTSQVGISAPWSTSPSTYLSGTTAGDGDYAIGVAFDIGQLAAGQTAQVSYGYSMASSITVIPPLPPVPEPETVSMMLGGLAVLSLLRRRKGKTQ